MNFSLASVGALVLCISVTGHASETGSLSPAATAGKFVNALQHQYRREAATMFDPGQVQDSAVIERTLKKIEESLGGFSSIRPISTLPDGKTIKLEVPAQKTSTPKVQRFLQFRYASTASDGQPVFYELNLTADNTSPQILSFNVHFPASDAKSRARANRLVSLIDR